MLRDTVIAALTERFGALVKIAPFSKEFGVFDARHPDVGDVVIEDDGEELIVSVGSITHGHFGSYDDGLSMHQHEAVIADQLLGFLEDLFADKVLLFKATWGGGWALVEDVSEKKLLSPTRQWFKWSGPIDFNKTSN